MADPLRFVDEASGTAFELEGAALPEPPIQFGFRPRRVVTDYGGRNQKSVQFLGGDFPPMQLAGIWKDSHLGEGESRRLANDLDALAQQAGIVLVEYGEIQRWGVIDFTYEERRSDWIEWELEVEILYGVPPETIGGYVFEAPPNDLGTVAEVAVADVRTVVDDAPPNVVASLITDATLAISSAENDLGRALGPLEDVATYAELTTDVIKRTAGFSKAAAKTLASVRDSLEATGVDAASTVGGVGGEQVGLWRDEVYTKSTVAIAELVALARGLLEAGEPSNGQTHVVQAGETIQTIARFYYGDISRWTYVADANDLDSTDLTPGQILRIPPERR